MAYVLCHSEFMVTVQMSWVAFLNKLVKISTF